MKTVSISSSLSQYSYPVLLLLCSMSKTPSSKLVLDKNFRAEICDVSVVMPCFNQESIIFEVLKQLTMSMKSRYEVIIIDDNSTDRTLEVLQEFCTNEFFNSNLVRLRVFSNTISSFETFCDYFGFSVASGKYLLEVQADMFISDSGFDLRMIEALELHQDIFALSGRGTHKINEIVETYSKSLGTDRAYSSSLTVFTLCMFSQRVIGKSRKLLSRMGLWKEKSLHAESSEENFISRLDGFPTREDFYISGEAGLLGGLIENAKLDPRLFPRYVYLGETIMRGPLMINKEVYAHLGGLNVNAFFQGFDDHELMLNAWSLLHKRCGYIPVNVRSSLNQGTTRKPRSLNAELRILVLTFRIARARKKTILYKLSAGLEIKLPKAEIREY